MSLIYSTVYISRLHAKNADKLLRCIAIVRVCGKADLFVTFTCNLNWPEITMQPLTGQTAADRLDPVCRIFALKLEAWASLADILKNHVLRRVKACVCTIEVKYMALPMLISSSFFTREAEYKMRQTSIELSLRKLHAKILNLDCWKPLNLTWCIDPMDENFLVAPIWGMGCVPKSFQKILHQLHKYRTPLIRYIDGIIIILRELPETELIRKWEVPLEQIKR